MRIVCFLVVCGLASAQCDPNNRTDCGNPSTKEADCLAKNCCWQPADSANGVPWCFFPSGPTPAPSPPPPPSGPCDPNNRTDCKIGDQAGCEGAGCCWQPAMLRNGEPEDTPWCFYHSGPSPACATTPQCSGHGSCTNGVCQCTGTNYTTCGEPSTKDCGINTGTDINNCGGCNRKCDQSAGVAKSQCTLGTCEVTCKSGYLLCSGDCVMTTDCSKVGPYSPAEMDTIVGLFLDNIDVNGGGAVMASPSKSNPNYYYHWMRDAAISMNVLLQHDNTTKYETQMQHYIAWVHATQTKTDDNCDVRAEPKFEIATGEPYAGGWMRPQSDGPALRTVTLVNYALRLIAAGQTDAAKAMWPSIQKDMDYVTNNWNVPSGDPWEEVKGDIFFTMFTQRKSLLWASKLALALGDSASASAYTATAHGMESTLMAHWNAAEGIIMELAGTRELDSAVHLGILYGDSEDGFLAPNDPKVQSSCAVLAKAFSNGYYKINDIDDAAGVPGLLVGRYPQDHYMDGCPWILTSNALGEIYYRNAKAIAEQGVAFTQENGLFFQQTLDHAAKFPSMHPEVTPVLRQKLQGATQLPGTNLSFERDPQLLTALVQLLVSQGDGQLLRVKEHIKNNGLHMQEQIGRDDGSVVSAVDLTWSYGTAIAAMDARTVALGSLAKLQKQ